MSDRKNKLMLGALLHDIGKILYCCNDGKHYSERGCSYLKAELEIEDTDILDQVRYHHDYSLKDAKLPEDSLAYVTYIADNVASAADRRGADDDVKDVDSAMALESIFNHLNGNDERLYYSPRQLSDTANYPQAEVKKPDRAFYDKMVKHIGENLKSLSYSMEYVNSLLQVLETELSFVSASAKKGEAGDISLYDHVKLTAAFAACIEDWAREQGIRDYRNHFFQNAGDFYKEKAFLLVGLDMSGIQNFIYTISGEGALKTLRSRSFYLEIFLEDVLDELFERLGLSRANLLYSGGGHAYLLLPNTNTARSEIQSFDRAVNQWLLEQFDIALFLGIGYSECSKEDLNNSPEGSYRIVFSEVSKMISEKKAHRYSSDQIQWLNMDRGKEHHRECRICRTSARLVGEDICEKCDALLRMSPQILYKGFFVVKETEKEQEQGVGLPFQKILTARDEGTLLSEMTGGERIYAKNKVYIGEKAVRRLWIGDYTQGDTFEELARKASGIERIAVLRADVDNLGDSFVNGFTSEKYGEKFVTISRTAMFSRMMSLFFKYHINAILKEGSCSLTEGMNLKCGERSITIVYSGGDDVFIVGSWDDVIGFAVDMHEHFARFTQGTLTFSAGIGIYPAKYPIRNMARETGALEEAAKAVPNKDAVALFEPDMAFPWEQFINGVLKDKFCYLQKFFQISEEKKKTFLYRLLELIRAMGDDLNGRNVSGQERKDVPVTGGGRINLARLAYMLARLEETEKIPDTGQFSKKVYNWVQSPDDKRQLVAAIYLYLYSIREKTEKGGIGRGKTD